MSTATAELKLSDPRLFREACYINGHWVEGSASRTIAVDDPATGEVIGNVPNMGATETRQAIDAAAEAFANWRKRTAKERAVILRRWFDLMMANQEDLAYLMTVEQGKPLTESRGEVAYAASFLEWFGAIAAGCTVALKPAKQTPFSALALAELGERAGIPSGVFNVITGSPVEIGGELASNPKVRKLSFTGSTEIGKLLMSQCAGTVKKLSLELGGNAPFIVFDDADPDAAVEGGIASKYRNTGQTCVCTNRFLVQDTVYDAFAERLSVAVRKLKPARGLEAGATQGPLIDDNAVRKVEEHIHDATSKGAQILVGGKRHALGGRFFEPTILTGVTPAMEISRQETFGPVAPLFRFKTEADAITLANDTQYGLAAYFYGRDMARIWRVAEALEYGIVGINTGLISTEVAPFGGMKESGLGREGSKYGIDEYLEIKYLCFGGITTVAS